ncbi:hypothetical protein EXIGLDRAFT_211976 [Exidia glandulosa HHB12029]|uniref:Secreted protein n=1 Tax=Exidia glandulosa HHB12029 TaxID=1314781 RepID=A0A165EJB6_EXIGL|nr:hypothetical protein EXIGLDRAFT_211976 [Exidia glandulosa HHB12029]
MTFCPLFLFLAVSFYRAHRLGKAKLQETEMRVSMFPDLSSELWSVAIASLTGGGVNGVRFAQLRVLGFMYIERREFTRVDLLCCTAHSSTHHASRCSCGCRATPDVRRCWLVEASMWMRIRSVPDDDDDVLFFEAIVQENYLM